MLQKLRDDFLAPKNRFTIPRDLTSTELRHYYFIFQEKNVINKDQKLISKFDDNGIPINKTYIDVTDQDYVYFPISIGQMGLAVYHTWLQTDSETDKVRFLNFAEWFKDNAEITAELGARWLTDVPLPQYKNPGPWQSAFAQSRAISILLRGYQLAGDLKYLELAEQALIPFTYSVEEGGVTSYTEWGPFYEEYTASVPTLVLNGMIFSLFGVYDFIRVFPENINAKNIFKTGIETLEKILPQYDLGFWSRYNLCKADWYPNIDPATIRYQRLHIAQLKVLHRLTGKEIFRTYWQKFRKQDNLPSALRMYQLKFKALKKIGRL
ncbi:MAG: hypothetical protein APR54_02290 [Candidatus Cloacimonas sp. SDB]|nr:MAG: hypothetical protein APR54_02290 [Candidatus Cloacimonas sp. SDB]